MRNPHHQPPTLPGRSATRGHTTRPGGIPALAERLRAAAEAQASASSRRFELALVLDWALASGRTVAVRRSEARELAELLAEDPTLGHLGEALDVTGHRAA